MAHLNMKIKSKCGRVAKNKTDSFLGGLMHTINYIVYYQAIYKEMAIGSEKEERKEDGCVIFLDEPPPLSGREMDGHWWTSFKCLDMEEVHRWPLECGRPDNKAFSGGSPLWVGEEEKETSHREPKGKNPEWNEQKGKRWMMLVRKTTLVVS
jgi:hypothetical protein